MAGLPRALFEVPLDGGLLTRGDKRAKDAPALERLLNAEFDDTGGSRVRFPFGGVNNAIYGGGTITNARRIVANGDELVLFTDTALYTWVSANDAWRLVGTHLAVACDEQQRFTTNDDQLFTDRAELGGVVFYVWSTNAQSYVAAADKATGAVLMMPTLVQGGGTAVIKPRIVAIATRVLLFFVYTGGPLTTQLEVCALDPANPSAGLGTTLSLVNTGASTYDVVKVPGADQAFVVAATSTAAYLVAKVGPTLIGGSTAKARAVGNAIAVSVTPDGVSAQVVRDNNTGHVFGDLITVATLADVHINQDLDGSAVGTMNHLTAAHRSVKDGGQYRCYWFVSSSEGTGPNAFFCRTGWVDDGGGLGFPGTFVPQLGLASRAFDYAGRIYVWLGFAGASQFTVPPGPATTFVGALQNTYFLYRDDAFLIAKAVDDEAAGLCGVDGILPGVALVNGTTGFAWCGTERRIVPVGTGSDGAYTARAPRDVVFAFDDNRARRAVRLGRTLYIAGGLILQYDGAQIVELGFEIYPWALRGSGAVGSNLPDGSYGVKATDRWDNAQGERDRSTTATTMTIALTGGPQALDVEYLNTFVTRKIAPAIAKEIWRTELAGSEYHLASSTDPAVVAPPNQYLTNLPLSAGYQNFIDNLADPDLADREEYPAPEELVDLPPPPATIIAASDTRLFLAGISGKPDTVWYSKQRQEGRVASFNDALTFTVPTDGGDITAIAQLEAGIVVWRETATYLFSGGGFDNTGGGGNYTLARVVSTTTGAESMESVCYDDGTGWFVATSNGWYLLDKAFNYNYVGAGVYRYDDEPVLATVMLTNRTQFRVVTPYRVLVLDTLVNKWAEWTIADGIDIFVDSSQTCWYLTPTGPRKELGTWEGYAGTDPSLALAELETSWIKPDGQQQGRYVVDYLQLLGEYRSDCRIVVQLAKSYEQTAPGSPNWNTTKTWTPTPTIAGGPIEVRTSPAQKRCASIKARITITAADGVSPLAGPCARLTSLTGQYAVEPGIHGALAAAQKQ